MAKLGLAGGILTQLAAVSAGVYTLWLLSALYHEFKRSEVTAFVCCCWLQTKCVSLPAPLSTLIAPLAQRPTNTPHKTRTQKTTNARKFH